MKLVYLHQYFKFPDENGGTRSYDLSKEFIKEGINVIVLTSSSEEKYKGKRWTVIIKDGLEIHYLYLPYDNSFSKVERILTFLKFLFYSSFHLLKLKCDIVLSTSTPLTIGIPAILKKWISRTPFVFEVRDVWPEAVVAIGAISNKLVIKILYKLEEFIYKRASAIVPLSIDMQKSIITRYPQFKYKTNVVIENIAEVDRFSMNIEKIDLKKVLGIEPRFSILYAGTFGQVNGICKVVELAEQIFKIDSSIVFILIGSGAQKKEIIELAKSKGILNKNVFVLEPISKDELPLWYNSVSMGSSFVIDIEELWANSANKFFDTLASNIPVLINYNGWQAELIKEQNIGYVLPFEINDKVISDFINYTQDSYLYKEQCKNAYEIALDRFSLHIAKEKYLDIIKKTVKKDYV